MIGKMRVLFLCLIAYIGSATSRSIESLRDLEDALIYDDLKSIDKHEIFIKNNLLTKNNCDSLKVPNIRPKTSIQTRERLERHFDRDTESGEIEVKASLVLSSVASPRNRSGQRWSRSTERIALPSPLCVTNRKASKDELLAREKKREESEELLTIRRSPRPQLISPFPSRTRTNSLEELDTVGDPKQLPEEFEVKEIKKGEKKGNELERKNEENAGIEETIDEKSKDLLEEPTKTEDKEGNYLTQIIEDDDRSVFRSATLLHYAVAAGALPIVHACLELGADPNALNVYGETPLFAVTDQHFYLVDVLVEYGALPDVLNVDQESPLLSAANSGNELVAIELVTKHMVDITTSTGGTKFPTIAWAAQLRKWELVKALAEAGADVNVRTMGGAPILHLAVKACRPDVVQKLTMSGADPNILGEGGNTPLHILMYHDFDTFEVDVEEEYEEEYFWNPQLLETRKNQFELDSLDVMKILLEAGANRSDRNFYGETPEQVGLLLHRYRLVERLKGGQGDS